MPYTIRAALALALSFAGGYALSHYNPTPAPTFTLLYTSPYNGDMLALDSGLSFTDCAATLAAATAGELLAPRDSLICEYTPE